MKARPGFVLASLALAVLFASFCACGRDPAGPNAVPQAAGQDRLWYRQPAADWNEALPVGNGRLGAMVFGHPDREKLQLNEETLWAGGPVDNNNPGALEHLAPHSQGVLRRRLRQGLGTRRRTSSRHAAADQVLSASRRSHHRSRGCPGGERLSARPGHSRRHRVRSQRDERRREDRTGGFLFGRGRCPGRPDRSRPRGPDNGRHHPDPDPGCGDHGRGLERFAPLRPHRRSARPLERSRRRAHALRGRARGPRGRRSRFGGGGGPPGRRCARRDHPSGRGDRLRPGPARVRSRPRSGGQVRRNPVPGPAARLSEAPRPPRRRTSICSTTASPSPSAARRGRLRSRPTNAWPGSRRARMTRGWPRSISSTAATC